MRKSPRILLIAFFALGTQGAVAGAGDHPLPVETLWNDFDSYARLLEFSWANRGFHERADRFDLDLKIAGMKSSFSRSPPATPQVFYLAVKKFSVSLHDGHLYAMFPRAEGAAAESQFSFAFAREGVVLTACRWDCEGVPLPAMVASIDGLPTEDWLRERAESSAGSTAFGRRHHALEDLSRYAGLRGEWTPPARLGVVLNSGTAKTLPFVWRQGTPPAPPAEPCIASSLLEGALVLRVRTFVCREAGESDPALWDKRFIAQMDQALNRPEPFGKILVDLRNNGGGMPGEAIPLAGHFLKAKTLYYRSRDLTRPDPALFDTFVEPDSLPRYGNDGELWSKPLWLLTDGGCFSQCSLFAIALVDAGRAKIVGTPLDAGAGGASSEPWVAPSGLWQANVPPWQVYRPAGGLVEGSVLLPDVATLPAKDDFVPGSDPYVRNALRAIP